MSRCFIEIIWFILDIFDLLFLIDINLFLRNFYALLSWDSASFKSIWNLFFCLRSVLNGLWASIYEIILFLYQVFILLFLIRKQLDTFHLIYILFSQRGIFRVRPLNQIFWFGSLKLMLVVVRWHWYLHLLSCWSIFFKEIVNFLRGYNLTWL